MKSKVPLVEKIDSLVGRGRETNIVEGGKCRTTKLNQTIISYEYERFLVAWVLLTRISQSDLDKIWSKYENELSLFAISLLTDTDKENETTIDNHQIQKNDSKSYCYNLLHMCYIRLVAQVTGRLANPPSNDLKLKLYKSWKRTSKIIGMEGETKVSTIVRASGRNSILLALHIDVLNAFVTWISQDSEFFASDLVMTDIWNAYVTMLSTTEQSAPALEHGSSEKQKQITSTTSQPTFRNEDGRVMIKILENILGTPIEADNDGEEGRESIYHVRNMRRLMIVIFEMQETKCASDELLSNILRWSSRTKKEIILSPHLSVLWDGWVIRNVGESLSKNKKNAIRLRDPEIFDAFQKIMLTYAVSPNVHDLRPLVWKTISEVIRTVGWSWIQKSSLNISICTWCQLACGELKIQLDEIRHFPSGMSKRCSIMGGCGSVISSIVQYLVDFEKCPDKVIPVGTKSLMVIRKNIEETLSLTSKYLNTSLIVNDDIELAFIINLWSELYSEIELLSPKETENMIACFKKLLLVSRNESLVKPLVLNALRLITNRSTSQRE